VASRVALLPEGRENGSPAERNTIRSGRSCWYYLATSTPKNDTELFTARAYDAWMRSTSTSAAASTRSCTSSYAVLAQGAVRRGIVKDPEPFLEAPPHQGSILARSAKMASRRPTSSTRRRMKSPRRGSRLRRLRDVHGPLESTNPWQTANIEGAWRFLDRVWNVCTGTAHRCAGRQGDAAAVHKTVQEGWRDSKGLRFNTAISRMMILVKELARSRRSPVTPPHAGLLVSPFAPHLAKSCAPLGASSRSRTRRGRRSTRAREDDVVEIGVS